MYGASYHSSISQLFERFFPATFKRWCGIFRLMIFPNCHPKSCDNIAPSCNWPDNGLHSNFIDWPTQAIELTPKRPMCHLVTILTFHASIKCCGVKWQMINKKPKCVGIFPENALSPEKDREKYGYFYIREGSDWNVFKVHEIRKKVMYCKGFKNWLYPYNMHIPSLAGKAKQREAKKKNCFTAKEKRWMRKTLRANKLLCLSHVSLL